MISWRSYDITLHETLWEVQVPENNEVMRSQNVMSHCEPIQNDISSISLIQYWHNNVKDYEDLNSTLI